MAKARRLQKLAERVGCLLSEMWAEGDQPFRLTKGGIDLKYLQKPRQRNVSLD